MKTSDKTWQLNRNKFIKLRSLMNCLLLILVFLIIPEISAGQVIKGKISNSSGQPIAYATVYIAELRQGTSSNAYGDYEIKLPRGKYMITYQSLGYQPVYFNVTVNDQAIVKDVILQLQYYQLPEVRVSATGEDPAYGIMRKSIGLAPYYLNNVNYFKANVYLKGNLVIRKFPRLLQKSVRAELKKRGSINRKNDPGIIKEGDTFLMESVNEMEFNAPDNYVQRVVSSQSSFPDEGYEISPLDYIEASFYEPVLADMAISPLSPQALNYYRFRYLGATQQGDFTVSKIEVIPKRKSQQLFYGTIYIIEDLWCLHSVDLTNENLAGKIRIQQLYIQFQDDIWMPVSHKFDIDISIMGFQAGAFYGSSVKYLEVKQNLSLDKRKTVAYNYAFPEKPTDTIVTRTQEQIGKILQKEELNNRDVSKLSRLMKKESDNSIHDSVKKDLEVKNKRIRIIEEDAANKDTAYWSEIRPIPLSATEFRSLQVRDSIRAGLTGTEQVRDSVYQDDYRERGKFLKTSGDLLFGHTWSDSLRLNRFAFGGLINLRNFSFNTVDGFIYGIDLRITKMFSYGNAISIYPDFRWAFSREKLMWRVNGNYTFGKMRPQRVSFTTGNASRDISNGGSINLLLNSATTLLVKKNYLKLYESEYFGLGYKIEMINGFSMEISGYSENRKALENTSTFSLNKRSSREYSPNIPDNKYIIETDNPFNAIVDQKHYEYSVNLTYTPYQKYRMVNNRKIPMGSDWPTFRLNWEHGLNRFEWLNNEYRHYDMIRFEAGSTRTTGAFSEIRWLVRSGGFIDNRSVPYYDFFHFNSQPLSFLLDNYADAFMLPPYYSQSTPGFFGEAHIKYTTPYLLIKLLPFLSNTLMRENISLSYLGSINHENYTEIGYSISEFFFFGEIGVYAGFDDLNFRKIGAKVTFRFN